MIIIVDIFEFGTKRKSLSFCDMATTRYKLIAYLIIDNRGPSE